MALCFFTWLPCSESSKNVFSGKRSIFCIETISRKNSQLRKKIFFFGIENFLEKKLKIFQKKLKKFKKSQKSLKKSKFSLKISMKILTFSMIFGIFSIFSTFFEKFSAFFLKKFRCRKKIFFFGVEIFFSI